MASIAKFVSNAIFPTIEYFRGFSSNVSAPCDPITMGCDMPNAVITDLAIKYSHSTETSSTYMVDTSQWHCIGKDLYLHSGRRGAYLHVALAEENKLMANDKVVTDVRIGDDDPNNGTDNSWEKRTSGVWVQRGNYTGDINQVVTGLDVLFGADAVDPRPDWTLLQSPLHLDNEIEIPTAKLTIRHGKPSSRPEPSKLRVREDGKFKIVQISDTHMVTGVGVCKDAIDAHGQPLPKSEADPLTVSFVKEILDVEKPDLVILSGDQLHHDILDSQSALFKAVAPMIERSIPYAAVFGNHDDEGIHALSRKLHISSPVTL